MAILTKSTIFLLFFFHGAVYCIISDETDPKAWGIKDDKASKGGNLAVRTAALKEQALKILSLRGIDNFNETHVKPDSNNWDDIQMKEDLLVNLKESFDEEQAHLEEANKPGNKNRATAPDFKLIPMAKWTSMPIKFSTSLVRSASLKQMIRDALKQIEAKSGCISFQEVSSRPPTSFILYREVASLGPGVCADSPLGRQPDVNIINVASTCHIFGTLIHETLHSLGFAHTQQRPDVDQFLTTQWSNINPQAASNFKPWKYALKNQGPFDFGSILMYPRTAFAINPYKDTMTPKRDPKTNGALMGQRKQLSDEDLRILKKTYGCSGTGSGKEASTERPKSEKCEDKLIMTCSFWAKRDYCKSSSSFASFVQDKCAKTCALC